jgi:predicted secreted protein
MSVSRHAICIRLAALIFIFSVTLLGTTTAQGPTQRIQFGRGRTTAVVKGKLVNTRRVAEAWQNYVLRVSKGQTITLHLTSPGDRAGFRLTFPNGVLAEDADGNPGHRDWSSEVPASGDCQIEVSHSSDVRVTPYTLEVTVR